MKLSAAILIIILQAASALAMTDIGLLNSSKSLGYYLMNATTSLSSGLVYNQKVSPQFDLEILYTAYNSFYLLTNNVTQLGVHGRYNLAKFGPLGASLSAGIGSYYTPRAGGVLTADAGGTISIGILNNLAFSVPVSASFFKDGIWLNLIGCLNYRPGFLSGYEFFGGWRLNAQVLGSLSSMGSGNSSASANSYYILGIRTSL